MELSNEILSDVTVHMKYAKYIPELKRRETWEELVTRNMEMHIKKFPSLEQEIKDNYKFVYDKMVLPSMRSLQFGGKPIEISPNRIYNCCFAPIDDWRVFSEIMFLLLGGTGVGYSVQYHHVEVLPEIRKPSKDRKRRWLVSDSIEGWADAVNILIKSYFFGGSQIEFDFSDIRPKGSRLITSGGKAPGPQPLKECLIKVEGILDTKNDGEKLSPIEVHDIVCHIADAVLAGGIRRAALISLFSANDEEMIGCKSGDWWEKNPQRGRSNNSAVLMRHKLTKNYFMKLWKRIEASGSGEPGIYLSNDKDWGTNPCCFIGSTLVATADGRNAVSIKQLCDENYRGPVYSVQAQTGQVITSHCSNVWKSRENAELVKVTLDDNSSFICTPDHRIMIRNGQYVQAQHLVEGTSLMPFNSYKRSDRNYRMIQSNTGRDIAQYAHVAQYYDIIKEGYNPQHIHHKDGNGLNDLPENLEAVDAVEHNRQHMLGEMNAETVGEFAEKLAELANHKVVSVEFLSEREDVYDMTVENTHNFAIITSYKDDNFINSSGVFVHNCEIALRPYQFCNLTEINVSNVESQEDYENRVRAASFIGTLQAGYTDFHYLRPIWKRTTEKDALIGISMTGIGSGKVLGLNMVAAAKIVKQENKRVAQLIGINKAARTTTVKPAGTTSLTLGTSSGIHAWHNDYYIRRVRVGKNEAIYTFLSENHPELIEDEYFRPHDTAVIGIPQKAPEGAILRNESPIQLLERVKKVHQEWIKPGHRTGSNTHNVSATISIREHEWPAVGEWMWDNKDFYNGLSVLPYDGGSYIQAPFTDCTKEEYEKLMLTLKDVDLSKIIELDDDTDLKGEAACSGGSCEIK
jgi:hypothetical protein